MLKEQIAKEAATEVAKGIAQVFPVIYQDVAQPAAKQVGKALETLTGAVNAALAPLELMVWSYEHVKQEFLPKLAEKLRNIPVGQITTPKLHIAGPVLEALKFTGHEPSLRELYLNLLATSMDTATAKKAHPAFVTVIAQITPDEARLLRLFERDEDFPLITVQNRARDRSEFQEALRNFSLLGHDAECACPELIQSYLDNLHRLRLVEITYERHLAEHNSYGRLIADPAVQEQKLTIEKDPVRQFGILKGVVSLTSFGRQFCSACVRARVDEST